MTSPISGRSARTRSSIRLARACASPSVVAPPTASVRYATRPSSVWRKRSSRGGPPVSSRTMRITRSCSSATSCDSSVVPSDSSASGSRCVWTETTSGTSSRIARSTSSAIACASSNDSSAGSLRWRESSVPVASATAVTLCTSRTRGTPSAAAWARSRTAPTDSSGSTWTTTSASGSASCTARSTLSAAAWPWRIAASAETPITTSAKWRPAAWRIRSRRSSTGGSIAAIALRAASSASSGARSMSTPMLRRMRRAAAARTSRATKSAARASPLGWPARASSSPPSTASEPARSLAKWRAFEANATLWYSRAARCDALVLPTSTAITTPITSNDHHVACTGRGCVAVRRITAWVMMKTLATRRNAASASEARCSAFPCPYWWPVSAGRTATPTAKKVSIAATRSVPEWIASETSPRLCVTRPVTSLSAMSAQAATTEPSAVRRCGLIGGSVFGRSGGGEHSLERPDDDVLPFRDVAERGAGEGERRDRVEADLRLARAHHPWRVMDLGAPERAAALGVQAVPLDEEELERVDGRHGRLGGRPERSGEVLARLASARACDVDTAAVVLKRDLRVEVRQAVLPPRRAHREPARRLEREEPHARLSVGRAHVRPHVQLVERRKARQRHHPARPQPSDPERDNPEPRAPVELLDLEIGRDVWAQLVHRDPPVGKHEALPRLAHHPPA